MHSLIRSIDSFVREDLNHKMVFIGGPRQVGKTTYSLSLLSPSIETNPAYLNWDDIKSKTLIKTGALETFHYLHIFSIIRTCSAHGQGLRSDPTVNSNVALNLHFSEIIWYPSQPPITIL